MTAQPVAEQQGEVLPPVHSLFQCLQGPPSSKEMPRGAEAGVLP